MKNEKVIKCYGSRPILRWLCSQLRYSRKVWDYVFVSPLDWRRYIQVAIMLLCLLFYFYLPIFSQASGIKKVNAQDPTPTPTYVPIWATPTPKATGNYTCPGYQPIGWGTVTPSWDWLNQCQYCVTQTPAWDGWNSMALGTPIWETEMPTVTPTPTAPTNFDLNVNMNWFGEGTTFFESGIPESFYRSGLYTSWTTTSSIYVNNNLGSGDYITYFDFDLHDTYSGGSSIYQSYVFTDWIKIKNLGSGSTVSYCTNPDSPQEWCQDLAYNETLTWMLKDTYNYSPFEIDLQALIRIDVTNSNNVGVYDFSIQFGTSGMLTGTLVKDEIITWWNGPIPEEEEEIITDCSEVEGEEEEDDSGFKLPDITIGDPSCFTLGGLTIPLGWLDSVLPGEFGDQAIPGLQICFAPIHFGSIEIFDLSLNMDFVAAAMAGIVLIRLITRS